MATDNNTNTTPAAPQIIPVTINGKKIAFTSVANNRAKGEEKGAPVLVPKWATEKPSFSEILPHAAALGDDTFAVVAALEIFRPLYIEASKAARTKNPDGTWSIDEGKFSSAAIELLRAFTVTQSLKAQLEAELTELEGKVAAISTRLIEYSMKGQLPPQAELNAATQLLLKRNELKEKLAKKSKGSATAAPAAAAAAK